MTDTNLTRRGIIALAAVALAGCTGSEDDPPEPEEAGADTDGEERAESDGDDEREIPDRDIEPDWDEAAAFRTWLIDGGTVSGNRRFDYTAEFPEGVDLENALPGFTDVTIDDVEGHLVQGFTQVFLGSFDPETAASDAEASDDAEFAETYEGYSVVAEELPDGHTRTVAVGGDAIVIGDDYEERIDARRGEGERLEDVDQEFTHLFRELPHETTVTGEYDSPEGVLDLDEIYLWGVSSESPTADEMAWVFIMEREEDLTEDVLAELEGVAGDVHDSSMDGRTATIVGSAPEVSEAEMEEAAGEGGD